MKLIKNLLRHWPALLLVFCLLIVQAFCDLSLPRYTSHIVDTGIQQYGVEDVATEELSAKTHDAVAMMLDEQDEATFLACYDKTSDSTYKLNDEGLEQRDQLDELMSLPMVIVQYSSQIEGFDLDQALSAYSAGIVSKQQVLALVDQAREALGDSDAILEQQAIAAAKAEYEALGYDMTQMQMSYLKGIGLRMMGLALLMMVISILVGLVASRTGAKIGRELRERLFAKVISFSEKEVDSFSAASLITRGTNDIQQIQMISVMLQRMVMYAPILAVGGIIMVMRTNVSMTWIIGLAVVAVSIVAIGLMAFTMPKFKVMQKLVDRVNLVSREILTGLPVIRAFNREEHEQSRFADANYQLMRTQLFTNRAMTFMMPCMMMIMNLTSCLIVWVGGHYIDQGTLQTGDLIAFITYSMVIIASFLMIGMIAILVPRANVAAGRVDEILEADLSILEPADPKDAQIKTGEEGVTISFEDVCFRYDDSSENVLDHMTFTAQAGKTTAIIGPTGCGKSTVIKLIERFYDVNEGRVTVDGIDVRDLSQSVLRSMLGYSPQQAFLFSGTVASNVGFAGDETSRQRSRKAIEVAQAAEFVDSKDEGDDFAIAQGGANVSGGQRQRLSIARAIATDARAYLFDDSFSALDYKTDAALRAELGKRLGGKTVLIVAQRIATIMHADNIIVLDEGRIVGQGTHESLMASCQEYREIAFSQLSPAELGEGGAA